MASGMSRKPTLDTRTLIRPGTLLVCAMADFDAADGYLIRLDEVGDVIRFSHGFCDEEEVEWEEAEELEESVAVATSAVEGAAEVMFLSQGSPSSEEDTDGEPFKNCTPPFLLSRRLLAAIKAREAVALTIYGETARLTADGDETVQIKVNGEERDVSVKVARDEENGMTVRVLDDPTWPLLLSAEFQGDNYIRLVEIRTSA